MNGKRIGLAILAAALTAATLLAQTPAIQNQVSARLEEAREKAAWEQQVRPALYEDVEILRRLLDRRLAVVDRIHFRESITGTASMRGSLPADNVHQALGDVGSTLEGTYLKGVGVVYSVTLPPPLHDPLGKDEPAAAKPLTPWERTRKELRGEKMEGADKGRESRTVPLADAVLRELAENGKHFNQLADDERITVAMTFRLSGDCAKCHFSPMTGGGMGGPGMGGGMMPGGGGFSGGGMLGMAGGGMLGMAGGGRGMAGGGLGTGGVGMAGGAGMAGGGMAGGGRSAGTSSLGGSTSGTSGSPTGTGGGDARGGGDVLKGKPDREARSDVQNAILLGDLHLKQRSYQEAIVAYQKALDLLADALRDSPTTEKNKAARLQPVLTALEVYGKLAQAQLGAGNADKAHNALEKAAHYARQAEEITGKPKGKSDPPKEATVPVPSKLIISASRKLLEQVGSGQMSFEEFRKAATIEYVK
jgi:tetratricopeptide (TPR) repeat protein